MSARPDTTIVGARVFRFPLRAVGGLYKMSVSHVTEIDTHIVELVTASGLRGYGEVCPLGPAYQPEHSAGAFAALGELLPAVLGLDAAQTGLVGHRMDTTLNGHNYAKSAVDVACWDVWGKADGRTVGELLGGAHVARVATYWGLMPDTADGTAAKAVELVAEGYGRLQLKTGGRPVADDVACMRAVADAVPASTKLLADANRGWTVRDALEFSVACADIPLVLEQPCRSYEEHRQLATKVAHPVFLDESTVDVATVARVAVEGVAQGFGMKLSRVGGLTKLRAVRDVCDALRMPLTIDDTWGGDLVAAATIHMGSTVDPLLYEGTWTSWRYMDASYPTHTESIAPSGGTLPVPTGPGLGVELDLDGLGDPLLVLGEA